MAGPLPGIDRWTTILRNAFRHRGPYPFTIDVSGQPVFDLSTEHPEFDDQMVYWNTTSRSVAALAANFSTIIMRCGSGRAIVDGVSILAQAGLQTMVLNLVSGLAAVNSAVAFQDNAYVSRPNVAFPISLGPLDINVEQTVGGRLAAVGYSVSLPAGVGLQLSWKNGTLPPFLISPNVSLVLETNLVNQPLGAAMWGRWFPEIDPA
jgi:hypothetical protein